MSNNLNKIINKFNNYDWSDLQPIKDYILKGRFPIFRTNAQRYRFIQKYKDFIVKNNKIIYKPLNLEVIPNDKRDETLKEFYDGFKAIGSGKTNFLINLLKLFCAGDKGTFITIHIITRNKDEPLYRWISSVCDQIIITEGLSTTPALDKFDKEKNHLVVFDDLVLSKDLSTVENYYIRAKKLNCSVIFISQSYFRIPKIIRNNCSYMVLLKLSGNREVNLILSEFGLGVSKEELTEIYKYATAEKFSPLLIDLEAEPDSRFRKSLLEIININQYQQNKI